MPHAVTPANNASALVAIQTAPGKRTANGATARAAASSAMALTVTSTAGTASAPPAMHRTAAQPAPASPSRSSSANASSAPGGWPETCVTQGSAESTGTESTKVDRKSPSPCTLSTSARYSCLLAIGSASRSQPLLSASATAHAAAPAALPASSHGQRRRRARDGPHSTPATATTTGSSTRPVTTGSRPPTSTYPPRRCRSAPSRVSARPTSQTTRTPTATRTTSPPRASRPDPGTGSASTSSTAALISRRVCGRRTNRTRPGCERLYVATSQDSPVDVVLPCLDEAASLPWVLSRLPVGYRAIVADNGSTDGSAAVAARHGAAVVPVPQRGFGAAAHAGLEVATAGFVCFCDADGSMDPAQLPRVLDPVRAGNADLVLGRRRPGRGAAGRARPGRQRRARPDAAGPHRTAAARPGPDAGRPPRGPARTRAHRPAVRLPAGDGDPRLGRRLARRGGRRRLRPPDGGQPVEGDRHRPRNGAHRARHAGGAGAM